jgi:hypothetical protein
VTARAAWGPVGFFLVVLGLGLRLDTPWPGMGWVCVGPGAVLALVGWRAGRHRPVRAFVPPSPGE